jgi:hypothetical protein
MDSQIPLSARIPKDALWDRNGLVHFQTGYSDKAYRLAERVSCLPRHFILLSLVLNLTFIRDNFNNSPSDVDSHTRVVYEDGEPPAA